MADKEVAIKISVEAGEGAKSLSSLKAEFKETQKILDGLDVKSQEYIKTLEKLGGIKDDIGDLNQTINAFNPEGKVQAFGNVIGGLASGFQAAQGAAALFGAEGEALQETLLKVQAASAFADGIKGVMGMGDAFKVLGKIIMANPILLVATIIVGIGAALFALKDKIAIVGKAFDLIMEPIFAFIDGLKQLGDWLGITSFKVDELAEKQIKAAQDVRKAQEENYDIQIARAKAAGKITEDLEVAKQKAIMNTLIVEKNAILAAAEARGDATKDDFKRIEALTKQYKDASEQIVLIEIAKNKRLSDEAAKAAEERRKAAEERRRKEAEEDAKRAAFVEKALEDGAKQAAEIEEQRLKDEEAKQLAELEQTAAFEQEHFDIKVEYRRRFHEYDLSISKQSIEATQALTDAAFAIRLRNVEKGSKEEQKILEKQFKINKAFQLATATISGIQAVQSVLASPTIGDPTGILQAIRIANTIAISAANIAKIAAMQFNGGGSNAGGASSGNLSIAGGGVAISPPQAGSTQLNPNGTVKQPEGNKQGMLKAFVVETDITSSQKKINEIEQKAKL